VIAKLTGKVDTVTSDSAIIDVNGVGYLVFCSSRTLGMLSGASAPVSLQIETHVREDHIHLYGFPDNAEASAFRLLVTVQGVGAKLALAILSTLSADTLTAAIAAQDRAALTRAPGVGPKLATRLLSELKDKIVSLTDLRVSVMSSVTENAPTKDDEVPAFANDAISALVNLGYGRSEAFAAVARVQRNRGAEASVETLIREGLKELAAGEARA